MKPFSIRQYVEWLTLIPLLIMAVSLETYFLHDRSADLDYDLIERGNLIARQLASSSEYGVFSNNQSFMQNIAQGVLQQPDIRGVIILNAASEILIEAGEFSGEPEKTKDDSSQTMPDRLGSARKVSAAKVKGRVNLQTPVLSNGESLWIYQPIIPVQVVMDELGVNPVAQQTGAVIIEMSWAGTEKQKLHMLWVTISATALFLLFSFYLVYLASRRITSPIRKLSDAVQMIGNGQLETRVSVPNHVTELTNLAHGINAMAAQLQQESIVLHRKMEDATRMAATAFESQESMMITDARGVILRVNKAFTDSTGYMAEEAVGQTPHLLKSGRHNADFYLAMWDAIRRTGTWQGEVWDRCKNGEVYPKLLTISAVKRGDGVITHYVGSHIDISERKAAEIELRQAKEVAELALAEQRQFIAMISHEYRSPLAVIDSAAQLLGVKLADDADTTTIVARIRRGVSRLVNFLDNCLTEDRIDSEGMALHSSAIDLDALAVSVKEGAQLISDGHQIIVELDPNLPLFTFDPQLLRIMLLNLLGNAIKYSSAGSEISLRIRYAEQACSFEVIDHGRGIPADELPFIFKKYTRGRASTSIPGAGLGLSLVSRIVALHGGHVEIESREGEGTRVIVTIPQTGAQVALTDDSGAFDIPVGMDIKS